MVATVAVYYVVPKCRAGAGGKVRFVNIMGLYIYLWILWPSVSYAAAQAFRHQGRIYSKLGPVQKKMWGPMAPNTIIGLLLPPYRPV